MPPDEPTTRAGDTGAPAATFRGGVERADDPAASTPTAPREPAPPGTAPASAGGRPGPRAAATATSSSTPSSSPSPIKAAHKDAGRRSGGRVRARKVRRIVRHVEPWSVLKISLLFYAALFLIVCVASALLWGAARSSGTVDNVESFITSVGGFGNCEPIDGAAPVTTTTLPGSESTAPVDQIDPAGTDTTLPDPGDTTVVSPGDEEDCREGEQLVGEFKFEDGRIFQAFALGGIVLVLAGSAANVVMVLLFNLMSDLTGGVRVTVLEEDPPVRSKTPSGSPPPRPRD